MRLNEVLRNISVDIDVGDFSQILYNLIVPDDTRAIIPNTTIAPYKNLRPILNENYTKVIIKNLQKEKRITPARQCAILKHLYDYSVISNSHAMKCVTLQPYVNVKKNKEGKYYYSYTTYNRIGTDHLLFLNDFKYITHPIEFVEKPCFLDVEIDDIDLKDIERLGSFDRCDQYVAHQLLMLEEYSQSAASSSSSSLSNSTRRTRTITSDLGKSLPQNASWHTISAPYLAGYFYFNQKTKNNESYTFNKKDSNVNSLRNVLNI